jgi:hypothetical protein
VDHQGTGLRRWSGGDVVHSPVDVGSVSSVNLVRKLPCAKALPSTGQLRFGVRLSIAQGFQLLSQGPERRLALGHRFPSGEFRGKGRINLFWLFWPRENL